ncbi:MAG: uroporphyrinogen-III C-methyltransferase [Candidatus Bathyarchaeia archaeon]
MEEENSSSVGRGCRERGKVYLVGCGPGDPDLLSVKTLRVLEEADVVVYDRLITNDVLKRIPSGAKRVYAGKHPGEPSTPQGEINELLVSEANKGRTVVRLKGGDPFLFGRGGEEAQKLREAGVSFEVVPGITSALAVPAYAGIPVTHRDYASSVAIVTGHEDPNKPEHRVKWERLAKSVDTIVVLMGVERLGEIVGRLLGGGLEPETSVAIIEQGTTEVQMTTVGTLDNIVKKAEERKVKPPAVIVIGDVVNLRNEISWFRREATVPEGEDYSDHPTGKTD